MEELSKSDFDDMDLKNITKIEPCWNFEKNIKCNKKLGGIFVRFLSLLYREVYGDFVLRPMPPIIGAGENVDLLRLFFAVRERGGYDEVSKNGVWSLVARECGYGSSVIASLKLVYVKYLDVLNRWLEKIEVKGGVNGTFSGIGSVLMELEPGFKGLLIEILEKEKGCFDDEVKCVLDFEENVKVCCGVEINGACETKERIKNVVEHGVVSGAMDGEFEAFVNNSSNAFEDFNIIDCDDDEEVKEIDSVGLSEVKENYSGWKRKRGCYSGMLKWMRGVAKDPRNRVFGTLPERSTWKSYGNDHTWKQVLSVREEMFLKIHPSIRENRQMHPVMYEDSTTRCSARVASVKESRRKYEGKSIDDRSDSSTDSKDEFWVDRYSQEPALIGRDYQAEVLKWGEGTDVSDLNFLGTQIFPLEANQQNKYLIERERVGKGRHDTCGCPSPGSLECVRFHICEKRKRVKFELGPAFYQWNFDVMGEEVRLSWTREEGKKFQQIVKTNPFSEGLCFWDELVKAFPSKNRTVLVSYYFNVFLIERRGYQNRATPNLIDSDDDEAELGTEAVKQYIPDSVLQKRSSHCQDNG
ncbi:hypothetical protein LIER_16849 [Lithospermum erythrorhizon]|uniref:ARID domain-containing protein n=1 Tax=Lithospermum erythrorhizon TaxID=34254 RepID=A0AAV3Q8I0_LITER